MAAYHKIKTQLDLELLLQEAKQLPYRVDGSAAEMYISQSEPIPTKIVISYIYQAICEIAVARHRPAYYMMINKLASGVVVPKHTDTLRNQDRGNPFIERWHLPLITNDGCWWWDQENDRVEMPLGYWYGPMPYNLLHQVGNVGLTERVHLIVDIGCKVFTIGEQAHG